MSEDKQKETQPRQEKKKYWLKLEKDFLNSNHIKVIKNMKNGKDYIIFYLAIMLASVSTEGHLKFTELIPYNEEMLASLTDTNSDTARSAVKIFTELGLMQFLEDGTIFLPDMPRRIGKESESADRVRIYREKVKILHCNNNVTQNALHCSTNKEKEKEEEEDKEKNKKEEREKEEDVLFFSHSQNLFLTAFPNKKIDCDIPEQINIDLLVTKINQSTWLKSLTQPLSWHLKNYDSIIADYYKDNAPGKKQKQTDNVLEDAAKRLGGHNG